MSWSGESSLGGLDHDHAFPFLDLFIPPNLAQKFVLLSQT